ncbi:kinesin heavy chain, putative [Perkinsus marinus ATCC 50983]|uniref:Kinesin-like protein n=1 Tax=Perkinsus marinus (strain ATCC 50983 / TXsc) TaxID=423536 RepID=C5L0S9_PERM5|nr:kinesin heavy chain, putative [Perkinsus marinus ATCC 50983]EER09571.1 kinesin heavy chain, putative [Perkinsus marinus ATCC 50983]|eukprot:XP_002777776.1 kinesin heavy chain, putative [Perkinsus marinus ATCC 50983]
MPGLSSAETRQVEVAVRVRPPALKEEHANELTVVRLVNSSSLQTVDAHGKASTWEADLVIDDSEKQKYVFDHIAMSLVQDVIRGYSACLLAYGQTGSGKTYTMLGAGVIESGSRLECPGIIPRAASELFLLLQSAGSTRFEVYFSYLEIFHDHLEDLLALRPEPAERSHPNSRKRILDVHVHPTIGVYVTGLTLKTVESADEIVELLRYGMQARALACRSLSDRSSLTHTIATLHVVQYLESNERSGGKDAVMSSKLQLVDLAGSERMRPSPVSMGRHRREVGLRSSGRLGITQQGVMVNKGLHQFALCITRLAAKSERLARGHAGEAEKIHVPYRDSKLTLLLREAFEGNALSHANEVNGVRVCWGSEKSRQMNELEAKIRETRKEIKRASTRGDLAEQEVLAEKLENAGDMLRLLGGSVYGNMRNELRASIEGYELDPSVVSTVGSAPHDSIRLHHEALSVNPSMCQLIGGAQKGTMVLQVNNALENRVFVNGSQVVEETIVRDGDRLRFGHSVRFRVVIPNEKEEVSEESDAFLLRNHVQHELEREHIEASCRESPEYDAAVKFAHELNERIGEERAQEFLRDFSHALPLVAEANALTSALRPNEQIRFSLEVVVDVLTYGSVAPEIAVRVWAPLNDAEGLTNSQREARTRGTEKRDIARRSLRTARVGSAFGLDTRTSGTQRDHPIEICELPTFNRKLDLLRELYDRKTSGSSNSIPDLLDLENNVWAPITCYDVASDELTAKLELTEHALKMAELELQTMRAELDQAKARLAHIDEQKDCVEPASYESELRLDLSVSERTTAIRFAKGLRKELSEMVIGLEDEQRRLDSLRKEPADRCRG